MKLQQISRRCYAVVNDRNRLCDVNSGLIDLGGAVVVDTQSDLRHAREMIEHFGAVHSGPPRYVVNTHEDGDHVWGNQLFEQSEIVGHRSLPARMQKTADPKNILRLQKAVQRPLARLMLWVLHPGLLAAARQLAEDYDFSGIRLTPPATLFDERHKLDLDGETAELVYVGPAHQRGDTIVHVPSEKVVFSGDIVFRSCTPLGWTGTFANWMAALDRIEELAPEVIVPGHGPVGGIEIVQDMRAYLQYVYREAKDQFDRGATSLTAAKTIDIGPFADWNAPCRLWMNVERAYREFRGEVLDGEWDLAAVFDNIYRVAKARGIDFEA